SPRVSLAWSPSGGLFGQNKTVIRGGYARIYGRLNGVDLLLVPLLGPGILQAVQCNGVVAAQFAQGGNQCLGSGGATPATAFRIGTDGNTAPLPVASQTFPQPFFPGVGTNPLAADGSQLDPKSMRPNVSDEFNFTIQRQLSSKMVMEVGYIGRKIGNE